MRCKEKAVGRQTTELQQNGERGAGTSKQPTWVFMRPRDTRGHVFLALVGHISVQVRVVDELCSTLTFLMAAKRKRNDLCLSEKKSC